MPEGSLGHDAQMDIEMNEEPVRPKHIQTKPVPYCPVCGAQMKLRRPRPDQDWDPFWGCSLFPDCKGTRQIMEDGRPETDDDIEWRKLDMLDDSGDIWHPGNPANYGDR